jgi:hypothetical protein
MLIAELFTIAKLWKQPRCPTTDEWINKMWYLYTMEFFSALKKNEILLFSSKWIKLENRRPRIICSLSYVDFRSMANTAMLLDLSHMLRGEHIQEVWG